VILLTHIPSTATAKGGASGRGGSSSASPDYSQRLSFRISGQAEPTASKGIGTVFRAGCDVGWDFVVADYSVLLGPCARPKNIDVI
jgi:hypothetical protein